VARELVVAPWPQVTFRYSCVSSRVQW
jgi:hypothetical protein